MKIRQVEGEGNQQVNVLDAKTQGLIGETRSMMQSQKAVEESEREKLETRLLSTLDHAIMSRDVKQVRVAAMKPNSGATVAAHWSGTSDHIRLA